MVDGECSGDPEPRKSCKDYSGGGASEARHLSNYLRRRPNYQGNGRRKTAVVDLERKSVAELFQEILIQVDPSRLFGGACLDLESISRSLPVLTA